VLLSLRHRTLVPSLNIKKENSRFDFADSPFYISRETKPWDVGESARRRAAVSSFGFSGTNAHLVIEEYVPPAAEAVPQPSAPLTVPLSARTPEQLRQKADELLGFIRGSTSRGSTSRGNTSCGNTEPPALASIAYTLLVGREAMEERAGFVVSSIDELVEKLEAYLHEGLTPDVEVAPQPESWADRPKPRRINLPGYPFARERCWFDGIQEAESAPSDAEVEAIEDIFNRIDDDAIETTDAIQMLRMML
jgi:acyl transferase domain-containing protein